MTYMVLKLQILHVSHSLGAKKCVAERNTLEASADRD